MEEGQGSVLEKLRENADLFGGSSSEEKNERTSPATVRASKSTSPECHEEEHHESNLSSSQRKKKQNSTKIKKPKKSEIHQLQSDTQRVIRESSINLPHYQPRTKTLDSFLTRLRTTQTKLAKATPTSTQAQEKENAVEGAPSPVPGGIIPSEDKYEPITLELEVSTPPSKEGVAKRGGRGLLSSVSVEKLRAQDLQTRLNKHMEVTKRQAAGRDGNGVASILSQETIKKFGDTPGAIREQWKQAMRRRVSQLSRERYKEQKIAEEARKMYDEEEEEEEEEMTDGDTTDTSDEEFVEPKQTADQDSDACSDLDQEEGVELVGGVTGEDACHTPETSGDEEEPEVLWTVRRKPVVSSRRLESEDEGDDEASDCEDSREVGRKMGVAEEACLVEGSMPLLRLDSVEDECSLLPLSQATPPLNRTDSGIGQSLLLQHSSMSGDDCQEGEGPERSGRGEEEEEEGSMSVLTDADSLELSFQWGQSLPLAQPPNPMADWSVRRKVSSHHRDDTISNIWAEDSQWQATPTANETTPSQECLDEGTQFLDEDGFLCVRKEKKTVSPTSSGALWEALDHSQQPSPNQLLNLCSGKFPDTPPPPDKAPAPGKPPGGGSGTQVVRGLLGLRTEEEEEESLGQDSSDEGLIGLCSGMFPASQARSQVGFGSHASSKASAADTSDGRSRDSSDGSSVGGVTQDGGGAEGDVLMRWAQRHHKDILDKAARSSEGGMQSWADHDLDSDVDEELMVIRRRKVKVKQSKGERLAEFVESEAELSGDDVGSDQDEEELLYKDEYEEEVGVVEEELGMTEKELWDQVNKAHLKHTFADDKADLQDLKERFLKEGDLYEDGLVMKNGFFRTRRFAQTSEAGSIELFSEERESGEEGEENTTQSEAKRRRDRLEKEEFIRKCRDREESLLELDQDSQSILSSITDTTSQQHVPMPLRSHDHLDPAYLSSAGRRARCSSFLKRPSTRHAPSTGGPPALHRSTSSPAARGPLSVATPINVGAGTGRGFVFQKATPATGSKGAVPGANSKRSAGSKVKASTPGLAPVKKPRLTKTQSLMAEQTTSIFSLYQ